MIKKNILLLAIAALIVVIPLAAKVAPEFPGSDGQAQEIITEIDPDYQPWFSNVFVLPGSEMESLLFALQAALGAGVLGFVLGRITARPNVAKPDSRSANPADFSEEP